MKETKEGILALIILGKFVADRMKDGLAIDDAMALGQKLLDEEFKKVVLAGIDGMDKIPDEVKHMGMAEVFELAQMIPEILTILKA